MHMKKLPTWKWEKNVTASKTTDNKLTSIPITKTTDTKEEKENKKRLNVDHK